MMSKQQEEKTRKTSDGSDYMNWNDVKNLARRVIRSASLAVMVHGELDVFTEDKKEELGNGEKLTG